MIKKYFDNLYVNADLVNTANIVKCLKSTGPHKVLLDVGCWDGETTLNWARAASSSKMLGIEIVKSAANKAKKKHISTYVMAADSKKWPITSHTVNCIVSNQVVEHLSNLDHFFSESRRVLAPNGILITSTNNLASWHNIASLLFGWTPFDLTNSSSKYLGIGNPFASHKGESDLRGASWTHKCIYTAKGLSEWAKAYRFQTIEVCGAGYYPFPAQLGRSEPVHSAFITTVMRAI